MLARPALGLVLSLVFFIPNAAADQRADFLAAENAYARKDTASYERLKHGLQGYPLLQYLEYREVRDRISSVPTKSVEVFLKTYPETPLADKLRSAWLDRLAKENSWADYVRYYDEDEKDVARRCQYMQALISTGHKDTAFAQAARIWLHGSSRPDACNPVFAAWRASGGLTTELVWSRIALAFDEGSIRLAKYLGRYLPAAERPWLDQWLRMHSEPDKMLAKGALAGKHPMENRIIAHGVKRMAASDPRRAADLWKTLRNRHAFTDDEACPVDERLAIKLEDEWDSLAYRFFLEIEPCTAGERHQEARIRAGLAREDWKSVNNWIDGLPQKHRDTDRWRYWRARALEALGKTKEATKLYRSAAEERTYYGFLAADRIEAPYKYDHVPLEMSTEQMDRVSGMPAVQRMKELLALDRTIDARREWWHLSKRLDSETQRAVARLYADWGWIDRAIFSAARADYWDDLVLRFPVEYSDIVDEYADERALDPSWVFGVLRQESAFMVDVRSPAGAIGLMQLMPDTAKRVARTLGRPQPSTLSLQDPETNIALGTGYLRMMLDELARNPVLATAAYNAGPHRVNNWMPPRDLEADIWVELIPFPETRQYVQRVMAYTVIYDQRRGTVPVRLSQRMTPIRTRG